MKRAGIIWNGYGDYKYPITDIEKTIVDCFDQPRYSGWYAELIRAFIQADLQAEKMITYCMAVNNIAVTKRIRFLSAFFAPSSLEDFLVFAKKQVNAKYNLIDSHGNEEGEFISEWKLRLNVSKENLRGIVDEHY